MAMAAFAILALFTAAEWCNFMLAPLSLRIEVLAPAIMFAAARSTGTRYYLLALLAGLIEGLIEGRAEFHMLFAILAAGLADWSRERFMIGSLSFAVGFSLLCGATLSACMLVLTYGGSRPPVELSATLPMNLLVSALAAHPARLLCSAVMAPAARSSSIRDVS